MSTQQSSPVHASPGHGHGHTRAHSPGNRHAQRAAGPLPIVVGVTGHRDLRPEDLPALEGIVKRILHEVQQTHPHTPLLLLSPLAEGSDRLVARVALQLGVRLVVPLPLPQALYEQDFCDDASRAEFRQLLSQAESSYVLPLMAGNTADGITEHGEQRNRQYAQVGALIAKLSQVFLALWDGVTGAGHDKMGGTGEVVRFRLDGVPPSYEPAANPLSLSSSGPVYHIITPRVGQATPDKALSHTLLHPTRQSAASFEELQGWMDQFNSDALDSRESMAAQRDSSKAQLLQVKEAALPEAVLALPHSARITLERYAVADTLAVHFAGQTRAASRQMFGWVFISALFFNLFHSLPIHPHLSEHPSLQERLLAMPWLLLLFLGASIVASYWLRRDVEEQDYQNKHQDYRAIAEALRIQFFWHVAGVPGKVVDHYLRKQRGALEWIRSALRAWDAESLGYEAQEATAVNAAQITYVGQYWVSEQRNYYASKARREQATLESEERRIEWLVRISVGLALLLAAVLTLPLLVPVHELEAIKHVIEDPWVHGTVMLVIVTLAVIAGLRHGYNQQMARSEHAKQFGRMAELFDVAEQHLRSQLKAGNLGEASDLLKELGQEALEENGDWVMLHRERPLEVPHSG